MQQTGKFHVYEIKDDKRVVSAIANATLYFLDVNNQKQFKLIAKTDNEGNFSFDLALGEYVVLATAGDGLEQVLANGSTFKLTAQSKVNAFEQWLNNPSIDTDSALLAKFREIMQRTETASESIKNTEDQLREDINKKWDKEEGVTALATKWDKEEGVTALATKWDKEEGVTALATKWDKEEGVTALATKWDKEEGVTALATKQDALEFVGSGKALKAGAGGLLRKFEGDKPLSVINGSMFETEILFHPFLVTHNISKGDSYGFPMQLTITTNVGVQFIIPYRSHDPLVWRSNYGGVWQNTYALSSANTAVDSNGFIKAASPIIKLFNDRIEHSGFGDNEPVFEKFGVGQYKISNTLGLAQEGWTYEKPRGSDGQPYFRIVVEKLEDGCIVRVHDEYDTVEKAEITDIDGNTRTVDKIVKILGQARDIKEYERWIDLRFHEEPEEHLGEELLIEQGENKESY